MHAIYPCKLLVKRFSEIRSFCRVSRLPRGFFAWRFSGAPPFLQIINSTHTSSSLQIARMQRMSHIRKSGVYVLSPDFFVHPYLYLKSKVADNPASHLDLGIRCFTENCTRELWTVLPA